MANARPEKSTSSDEDSPVEEHDEDKDDVFSNGKQNGGPATRSVDRYGFMGGDHYTSPEDTPRLTLEMIRKREVKWIDMFENWEKWMTKRFKKVKARCRKGIPPSLRARAWQHLCGSSFLMNQNAGKFDEYLSKAGDPKWIEDIKKDLHRQFPLHEIFALRGGHGQEDLFRILKAYTIHNPQEGYCQAQGPIAAVLLMHMPAEQAFWCLVSICEKYLPGYYSLGLEAVHVDGDVLFGLLKKSSPIIYKHLKKQRIEPILYMTEWFMCIFSRTLPWTAVLRVWDMFFCEGVKVMFRIALILFKMTLGTPGKLSECPSLYETMDKLKHIPHQMLDGDFIARESLKLNIDEKDMEKEHQRQITKRRNLREKALKEASASKGKKEKKKLLGKLTKKDSENKLLQQPSTNVMLISSQKLPETTQKAQPKMVLPISASSPTVGQMTTVSTIATTNTTTTATTSVPQRWSADLDAHSNINSHMLYASQISTEDESQRSAEQLPDELFAHEEKQRVQETLAPMHSKSVLVPAEEIRQQFPAPPMMAPRAIKVMHTSTAAVSEAVPARVLPIHLNEPVEVVTASEPATTLHIEGVVEPTFANARHTSNVAAPEVRMVMPQPQSQAEVNSNEVRPEGDHSQTTSHTSQSVPTHSEPVHSDLVTHTGGVQSDVVQPKPKSKSKSRSRSKPVKIELVRSEGGGARGVISVGGGGDRDARGSRPTLTSFGQRSNSSNATSSSSATSSSKSTVTKRTKTRTTEEERTSTTIIRRSMETGETTVMSTSMSSSTSSSSWKEKPESGGGDAAPTEKRPHSATFNNTSDGLWNIVDGTPVDSLRSTTVTTNIATTTSAKSSNVTASTSNSTTTDDNNTTASAITNSPTDVTAANDTNTNTNTAAATTTTTTTTTTINNSNVTTTTEDKDATSPKTPNELSMNCDATSPPPVLAVRDRLSEEDMLSLRESRL